MAIKVSVEDISELFNHVDEKGVNKITKPQFTQAISSIPQKVSGPSSTDATPILSLVRSSAVSSKCDCVWLRGHSIAVREN